MNKFTETGLNPQIINALDELGFQLPTPVQRKSIPYLLSSEGDLIALAQTGTGKTAAFGLPLIQKISSDQKGPQALILCPTRELCLQITQDFQRFAKYLPHIKITPVYGGANIETQIKALQRGSQIIISTPGRLVDLIRRKKINLLDICYLVLDEADEMLNMGFKDELDAIIHELPSKRQTLLFSATMSGDMNKIANDYLTDPFEISTGKRNVGSDDVRHIYYMVNSQNRYLALKRVADINPDIYGIVFCRTRRETKEVADHLIRDGYNADALYGDLSQAQRESVMGRFREKRLQLLVATDVAARGLDVNNITHVINYNLPDDNETYVHRSGRTGRAGNQGISICIIHSRERRRLKEVEQKIGKKFEYAPVPTGREICEKQLFHLVNKTTEVVVDDRSIEIYLPMIYEKLVGFDREELIKRFASVEFNRFLSYYKNAQDINLASGSDLAERPSYRRSSSSGFSNLLINIGAKDGLTKLDLIGLINKATRTRNIDIGNIEIAGKSSFFEVDSAYQEKVISGLNQMIYQGKGLSVEFKSASESAFSRGKRTYSGGSSAASGRKRSRISSFSKR
ncbi:DEAD/DEAH box helicase [Bacteroidetes bacterium endosymbiont of Geopemphigus sp.]|uniref:DEAD/DEAH box helicase n=1 Tax=Bacteroidetes bacterium endosymbiont of Geopemphigus sp. TaxID=2047937 RepID=UPI000CD17A61|nr:DEAD/DEAH box helicase [Bacteroidetes bacterium endosymbiont of Geopemphigus sp.]